MALCAPTLSDVYEARRRIRPFVAPTPLMAHPLLNRESGLSIWIKHENHNPTGAFKVRGGINLVAALEPHERRRGFLAASTGNHGQSVALAARMFGTECTVFVPEGCNSIKKAAIEAYGANVREEGRDFDDARERCEARAASSGARYIHNADEPLLIAGVGTYALEIFEDLATPDVIYVPVGGGSGACGVITVRNAISPRTRVVGVGAVNAGAFARAWKGEPPLSREAVNTIADGVATRVPSDFTLAILRQYLDDFILLTEEQLAEGVRLAVRCTHNLAEPAGAAAIVAAVASGAELINKKVVVVMTGGNLDIAALRQL